MVRKNVFPIACDSFGNYIMIGLGNDDTGKIYFCDHEKGNKVEYITENFKKFNKREGRCINCKRKRQYHH